MRKRPAWALSLFLLATILTGVLMPRKAEAFEHLWRDRTYFDWRQFSFGFGFGHASFVHTEGLTSSPEIGFRISLAYHFTSQLELEFYYQLAGVKLTSPNPVSGGTIDSTILYGSEIFRLIYRYDRYNIQPYVFGGFGFYNVDSIARGSSLSFPNDWQYPVGAGVLAFLYKNRMTLSLEWGYSFIIGENQSQGVLDLLGIPEVKFNAQSIMMQWHFYLF